LASISNLLDKIKRENEEPFINIMLLQQAVLSLSVGDVSFQKAAKKD